ncbi:MAG: TlpA disulfide reductase family protein [Acidobacteriota bacterium]
MSQQPTDPTTETKVEAAVETEAVTEALDAPDQAPEGAKEGSGPQGLGMIPKLAFGIVLALALAALLWPRGDGTSLAPNGFLLDSTGRPTTLANHTTQVTLLHFWATWCPPCITEIPALQRLAQDFSDRPGFQVMMVAVDDDIEEVKPFVGDRAFSVLYDPTWDVAHRYGTRKLPETYVLVNGRVIEDLKYIGAQNWDNPEVRRILGGIIQRVEDGAEMEEILAGVEQDRDGGGSPAGAP